MLYELLYSSEASSEMTQDDLLELLEQSRTKNRFLGITGLLLYHNKEFMQLLEGEKSEVLKLWETIKKDERHFMATAIYQGPIPERGFSEWSIAFQNIDGLDIDKLPGFSDLLKQGFTAGFGTEKPSTARNLMAIIKNNFLSKS